MSAPYVDFPIDPFATVPKLRLHRHPTGNDQQNRSGIDAKKTK
jgi:hypothetical protein